MPKLIFITHPEVIIDPDVPVPRWRLSDVGVARMRDFVASDLVADVSSVWASTEAKAIEGAGFLAARFGLGVSVDADLGENDRSSTGFLPPPEFEKVADEFFARPEHSVLGWERAVDAQARVRKAVSRILADYDESGDIAIVAHGAVGALLLSGLLNEPISRERDQPFAGHFWIATVPAFTILQTWEQIAPRA